MERFQRMRQIWRRCGDPFFMYSAYCAYILRLFVSFEFA